MHFQFFARVNVCGKPCWPALDIWAVALSPVSGANIRKDLTGLMAENGDAGVLARPDCSMYWNLTDQ